MARYSFGSQGGRVRRDSRPGSAPSKSAEELSRELRASVSKAAEEYRQRSLALHGSVCARCGRDFSGRDLRLLTVHHRDGNHQNNPSDGSNWENLCVYCHDDAHSRGVLAEHVAGVPDREATRVVHEDPGGGSGASLGDLLKAALEKKER